MGIVVNQEYLADVGQFFHDQDQPLELVLNLLGTGASGTGGRVVPKLAAGLVTEASSLGRVLSDRLNTLVARLTDCRTACHELDVAMHLTSGIFKDADDFNAGSATEFWKSLGTS